MNFKEMLLQAQFPQCMEKRAVLQLHENGQPQKHVLLYAAFRHEHEVFGQALYLLAPVHLL